MVSIKHILFTLLTAVVLVVAIGANALPPGGDGPIPEMLTNQDLDDEALDAIRTVKEAILKASSPTSDVIVFIGNSGSYFYHAIKKQRDAYLVPISGRYLTRPENMPSKEARTTFQQVFLLPIIKRAFYGQKNIILVDHSQSGQSVDSFNEMLQSLCLKCRTEFINIIPQQKAMAGTIRAPYTVQTIGHIYLPYYMSAQLFNDGYVRLSPQFPHGKWHEATASMMREYEEQPRVRAAIAQIMANCR
jgi:hypothetical protein